MDRQTEKSLYNDIFGEYSFPYMYFEIVHQNIVYGIKFTLMYESKIH